MINKRLFLFLSKALLVGVLFCSCDSEKVAAETEADNQASDSNDLGWIPDGAAIENLPTCSAAIKPPKNDVRPTGVIEMVISEGTCKITGPLITTKHGPVENFWNISTADPHSRNAPGIQLFKSIKNRVAGIRTGFRKKNIRSSIYLSIQSDTPAIIGTILLDACTFDDTSEIFFVTKPHEGDQQPFRLFQHRSSSEFDLSSNEKLKVGILSLAGENSRFSYGSGGGKFDFSSPGEPNPQFEEYLDGYLKICKVLKMKPRARILFFHSRTFDHNEVKFQSTMHALSFFVEAGIEEFSLRRPPLDFLMEETVDENPKLNINRVTPPPKEHNFDQ